MIEFFIKRPIFATVIALLMVIAGGLAMTIMPVSQFPPITPPTVQVSAFYPGASAETTSDVVTRLLERQINGVPGMIYMSSNSVNGGNAVITVTFDVGYDLSIGTVDVQNYAQTAIPQLPPEVQRQGISSASSQPTLCRWLACVRQRALITLTFSPITLISTSFRRCSASRVLLRFLTLDCVSIPCVSGWTRRN